MTTIGEVVEAVREQFPVTCWEPNEEYTAACLDARGHHGPHGWDYSPPGH